MLLIPTELSLLLPKPLYAVQIPCKILFCFQCICGFTRPLPKCPSVNVLLFSPLDSPLSRTHGLTV